MRAQHSRNDLARSYSWDRRPASALVELAAPGGDLAPLGALSRSSEHPIIIDFWADHDAHVNRLIGFVGLRRVFEITWQPHRLRVDPGRILLGSPSLIPWAAWLPLTDAAWVGETLAALLTEIAPTLSTGSAVAVAGLRLSPDLTFLAGRFLGAFRGITRREVVADLSSDIIAAVERAEIPGYVPAMKPAADALYLGADGGLVVAEIESARAAEVTYAPAQALVCLRLLRLWTEGDEDARSVLEGVVAARRRAGLLEGPASSPDPALPSTALVAIEAGLSDRLRGRLQAVWHALIEAGIPEAHDLRVEQIDRRGTRMRITA
ncbi:hypothetical protein M4I32_12715 [Microbacterium sp. LRZ72]|uniref:hypothetical protein n=1 Tax=Microbacterium sp. LRZ72 TaxID=2942481 RepID=UPI0029B4068D|nr:hypothetical protein [Microbacterium sp. LRZ72]MDX2377664.1 hypothetical protein [Microbacterium sp. LRZ72]